MNDQEFRQEYQHEPKMYDIDSKTDKEPKSPKAKETEVAVIFFLILILSAVLVGIGLFKLWNQ
jgi:hypothetical protein